jgi:hypothetical protein
MTYDPGKGALFKNMKKTEPQHCDYRGECNIDGKPHWVNAWIRTAAKSGDKYMALSFQPKEPEVPRRPAMAATRDDPFNI